MRNLRSFGRSSDPVPQPKRRPRTEPGALSPDYAACRKLTFFVHSLQDRLKVSCQDDGTLVTEAARGGASPTSVALASMGIVLRSGNRTYILYECL